MIDVRIRGRCRHKEESDSYMSLSNVKGALYSFVLRPRFILSHWVLLLGKVLTRQHYMHPCIDYLSSLIKGKIRGSYRLQRESLTHHSKVWLVLCTLFPFDQVLFYPTGFCYLVRFLMRQQFMHYSRLWLGTRGSVEGKTQLVCLRQSNRRKVIKGLIVIYCNSDYL